MDIQQNNLSINCEIILSFKSFGLRIFAKNMQCFFKWKKKIFFKCS